jgi:hypothetical protein
MYRRIFVVALASLLCGTASAKTLELVEGAYEAALDDVILPGSVAGTLILQVCDSCDAISLPVNSDTVYIGTSGAMSLADFRDHVADIRQNAAASQTTAVGVYYNLETNRITRVSLHADGK